MILGTRESTCSTIVIVSVLYSAAIHKLSQLYATHIDVPNIKKYVT